MKFWIRSVAAKIRVCEQLENRQLQLFLAFMQVSLPQLEFVITPCSGV